MAARARFASKEPGSPALNIQKVWKWLQCKVMSSNMCFSLFHVSADQIEVQESGFLDLLVQIFF